MSGNWFDHWTQHRETIAPRRNAVAVISGAVAALFVSGNRSAVAGCKYVGRKCDKNKDCCDGARCKGGKKSKCHCKSGLSECPGEKACKNLDTDSNHCGACNSVCPPFVDHCVAGVCASCPAGANHCVSATPACQNDPGCFCLRRLEDGVAVCADLPRCDEPCSDESDCPGGPSICVAAGDICCPGSGGQGRCAEVCGA